MRYVFVLKASKHSVLSASSAERWLVCPGSVRLSNGIEDRGTSIYAAEGTAAHHILSRLLTGNPDLGAFEGTALVENIEVPITPELLGAVHDTLKWIYSQRMPGDVVKSEHSISSAVRELDPDFGGTADVLVLRKSAGLIWVIDYKHGAGVYVPVQNNAQLKYYALGALLSTPGDYGRVRVSIAQPRIECDEGRFRSWDFSAFDLLDFATQISHAAKLTRTPDAPLVPGDHCKATWCPARRICPALAAKQNALVAFGVPVQGQDYDAAALGRALDDMPLVEARIKALREFAYQEALRGVSIPGHKLVNKTPIRKWKDPEAAAKTFAGRPELFTKPELVSPTQAQKILGKEAYRELCGPIDHEPAREGDLVHKVSSGTVLVPESDARPSVQQVEFDALPLLEVIGK